MFQPTEERQHAAMYAAIGNQCDLSARGYGIIFVDGFRRNDRADLSDHRATAEKQLEFAGIDVREVTDEQLAEYQQWRAEADERHALETAHFVITAPRGEVTTYMHNHVQLKVSGEVLVWGQVYCGQEYDPDAINNQGRKGAYALKADAKGIQRALDRIRKAYPQFADAPVTNNTEASIDV